MTSWAGLQPLLRTPVLGLAYSVVFDGEEFDPETFKTGDMASPGSWVYWQTAINGSEYGTYSGADQRWVYTDVFCQIYVEPTGSGDKLLFDIADALETAYTGQDTSQVIFHIARAWLNDITVIDGGWMRRDWRCPVQWFKEAT